MILSHGAFFVNMIVKEFVKFAYLLDWFSWVIKFAPWI
jgi:hypothetical protein